MQKQLTGDCFSSSFLTAYWIRGHSTPLDTSDRIDKIHTEVEAPAVKVDGLRVRGVTFVGQTEEGTLQIIANEDAPLGKQPFIRLSAVGVVEDQAVYHGSCFLNLEITNSTE